jgi:hypothetical protein
MAFPIAAVLGGISLASQLFGKKKPAAQQGGASPFMNDADWNRYMALRDIMKKVRSPYLASLYGRSAGGIVGEYPRQLSRETMGGSDVGY